MINLIGKFDSACQCFTVSSVESVAPRRCYGCGQGFRSHNKLHWHLARGECEATLVDDGYHLAGRGRTIDSVVSLDSKGRTKHVSVADRGRAISAHRRDVLDVATSSNLFPYLQSHFSNSIKIVRFQIHDSYGVDFHVPLRNHEQPFSIHSFIARSSGATPNCDGIVPSLVRAPKSTYCFESSLLVSKRHNSFPCEISWGRESIARARRPTRREDTPRAIQCKAVFSSSTNLQTIGLEGESKAINVLAPNVLSALNVSSMHDVPYECNTTAPALIGTACMSARSATMRASCTFTCGHFGCAGKDVVLGSYFG